MSKMNEQEQYRYDQGLCIQCGEVELEYKNKRCPICLTEHQKRPRKPNKYSEKQRQENKAIRIEVLSNYGFACNCCGEDTFEFLTFDHINNDGAEHRRELSLNAGTSFTRWLRDNNYPDNIQILCWNCNAAKQYYGGCPHARIRSKD